LSFLKTNKLWYWDKDPKWGWSLQFPISYIEWGKTAWNPAGERFWFIEWRFPFRKEWHMWEPGLASNQQRKHLWKKLQEDS
jgi:hypothetical protein